MSTVTVIIPAYNNITLLVKAIDSVLNQTYKNLNIVIVDDGSSIDLKGPLLPYLLKHNNITYIYQDNKGTAAARNTGIANSISDYIALLDHDDLWDPNKIQLQVDVLDSNEEIGLVYCGHYILEDNNGGSVIKSNREYCRGYVFKDFLYRNYITTASQIMFRRSCVEIIGGFNETLSIVDDYDFYIRLSKKFKFEYINSPLVYWRRHSANTSNAYERMQFNRISLKLVILKNNYLSKSEYKILLKGLIVDYNSMAYFCFSNGIDNAARKYYFKIILKKPIVSIKYLLLSMLNYRTRNKIKHIINKFKTTVHSK